MKKELVPFRRGFGGEKAFQRDPHCGEEIPPTGHNSLPSPENALPFGFVGRIGQWLIVQRQLEQIFSYRTEAIERIFSTEE